MKIVIIRKLLPICAAAALILPMAVNSSYAEKLLMATEGAYPPFN